MGKANTCQSDAGSRTTKGKIVKAGTIVIGKRVGLGAAIMGVSEALQAFYPEHAQAIGSLAVPVIFIVQVFVANRYGITQ